MGGGWGGGSIRAAVLARNPGARARSHKGFKLRGGARAVGVCVDFFLRSVIFKRITYSLSPILDLVLLGIGSRVANEVGGGGGNYVLAFFIFDCCDITLIHAADNHLNGGL